MIVIFLSCYYRQRALTTFMQLLLLQSNRGINLLPRSWRTFPDSRIVFFSPAWDNSTRYSLLHDLPYLT
jgi:hypothetical protein